MHTKENCTNRKRVSIMHFNIIDNVEKILFLNPLRPNEYEYEPTNYFKEILVMFKSYYIRRTSQSLEKNNFWQSKHKNLR